MTTYIKGEIFWNNMVTTDQFGNYQFELHNYEDGTLETLKELGVTTNFFKSHEEKGDYLQFRSKNYPFRVFDSAKKPVGEDVARSVGNGSKVAIKIDGTYQTTFGKTKFVKPKVVGVYILELIKYEPEDDGVDLGGSFSTNETAEAFAGDDIPF